mgnify:CR=1 FL=1
MPVEYPVKTMNKKRAVLSLVLIVLLGSQWLVPSHIIIVGTARPLPLPTGHSAHGYPWSTSVAPLHHPCCEQNDGASGFHEGFCCGTTPALPSAVADLGSYTPYLSLTPVAQLHKSRLFLKLLWHPPTL